MGFVGCAVADSIHVAGCFLLRCAVERLLIFRMSMVDDFGF